MFSDVSTVIPGTPGGRTPFADRYELKNQAGVGGMGTVYQAIDRQNGALVALKILHSRSTIEQARFDQEARVLAELSHPGIVRYFDHGVTPNGSPFIAMEWLEGETLEDRLGRGTLGPAASAHVARLVLEALSAAHSRDIVHRDIKPGNIFLVGWKLTEIRLLDFGIARRVFDAKRLTRKGSTVGTPLYTSPEQARGRADVDGRADIFSLGCVLYEALTGDPPFSGETPLEVMTKVCSGIVSEIGGKRAGLPDSICRKVHSMLASDPYQRPSSAAVLAQEFAGLSRELGGISSEIATTRPPSPARHDAISEIEEHLACAMLVSLGKRDGAQETARPLAERRLGPKPASLPVPAGRLAKDEDDARMVEIRRLLETCACEMDRLINRTLLMTAPTVSTAQEQAIQLASAALALRNLEPDAKIALATGRATFLGRLPVGRLMDRLPALMEGQDEGTIRLDQTTRRLLPARFLVSGADGNALLQSEAKSLAADSVRASDGQESPFLGRDRDLASLASLFEESRDERLAHVVLVIASAGYGKTRLVREFLRRIPGQPPLVVRGAGTLLRVERRYPTLAPVLASAGIEVQDKSSTHVENALAEWLSNRCEESGLLLILDDLQWADSPSLEMVDHVMQMLHEKPIMVVGSGRDEVEERFPGLWNARAVQRFRLRPLPQRHGQTLLRHWAPPPVRAVDEFILERWEGNPLFLEELVASTRDGTLDVSETVYAIVEGRLDGLEPDVRRVLRAASLYGEKLFGVESLIAVLGEPSRKSIGEWMEVLVMRALIERDIRLGEASHHFRERLVRDAAYRMLPSADRLLARRLARSWLEGEGRTLPETLRMAGSQTDVRSATAG